MATKKKKIATEAAEAPKETAMDLGVKIMELARESGTTEAEYQEPVVPVADPVDEYLRKTYPRLEDTQNIPKLLYAILRELVARRF